MKLRNGLLTSLGVALSVLGGCASQRQLPSITVDESPLSATDATTPGGGMGMPDAQIPSGMSEPYLPGGWSEDSLASASESSTNAVTASFHKAVNKVTDAFKMEPKVVAAPDPVSLSSQPKTVGSDLHFHAARVYESQGNIRTAIAHYEKAIEISPDDYRLLVSCARLYDRLDDVQKAKTHYHRAIELQPENPIALNDLGMCHARHGSLPDAAQILARATALQPQNKRYRNNLASVLLDLGQPDQAVQHLAAVHGEAGAHYNLGYLASQRNQTELARQHFLMALQLDPSLTSARAMLGRLQAPLQPGQADGRPAAQQAARGTQPPVRSLPPT